MSEELQNLMERVSRLTAEQRRELMEFVEGLERPAETYAANDSSKLVWEIVAELTADVPQEVWRELPCDGSLNVDHYLYGAPKR